MTFTSPHFICSVNKMDELSSSIEMKKLNQQIMKKLLWSIMALAALTLTSCSSDDDGGSTQETCSDGIQNQGETGVDCGGPNCQPCMVMATCTDGIQNGDEEGVDCGGSSCAPCTGGVIEVTGNITSDVTWSAGNIYELQGRITVTNGAELTIEPGTIIKAFAGTGANASVLIVARDASIQALGTASAPIVMTSIADNIELGQTAGTNLNQNDRGLWGGLIVLGNAPVSLDGDASEAQIEGIPASDPNGLYGGDDPADSSGTIQYVSIRHGGALIGEGNEINGLTLGGVGSGTTIDNVEVVANVDDGIEFFGGTVSAKHLIAAFCGDDAFDHDEGLRGKFQFLFAIQDADFGNMCGEHDGAPASTVDATPLAYPVTYNATFLGSGQHSDNVDQARIFLIRENWGGEYNNCIFGDYNGYGLDIEDKYATDSRDRLEAGQIKFLNNIWFNINGYTLADSIGRYDYVRNYLNDPATHNVEVDPQLNGISRTDNGGLDPRPAVNGPAYQDIGAFPTAITLRQPVDGKRPKDFMLAQNYPNPFNPATIIEFSLPTNGNVSLDIFNMMGQHVATLLKGQYAAGVYHISWNAASLPSGIYYYRLQSDRHVEMKKMLLIK